MTSTAVSTPVLGGDLTVARLGYGTMQLTGRGVWGEPADRAKAKAILRRAVELGVRFIDTADVYGPEVTERLIAEALHPYPDGLVIGTKGGLLRTGPGSWHLQADCRPERLRRACEASLRRLRLERIDLYQLHTVDPQVPLEESVGALAELRREGKIRHVGLCNVSVEQVHRARTIVPVVSVQNRFNLVDRWNEDVLDLCQQEGIPFICWCPLGRGDLGTWRSGLGRIAARHHATPAQVALAWLLHRAPITVPIPGTSSPVHLEENVAAAGITLAQEDMLVLNNYRPTRVVELRRAARSAARRVLQTLRKRSQ
jgi:aryl-alcohol dehydrogenase-like predicted oxidoreductase